MMEKNKREKIMKEKSKSENELENEKKGDKRGEKSKEENEGREKKRVGKNEKRERASIDVHFKLSVIRPLIKEIL